MVASLSLHLQAAKQFYRGKGGIAIGPTVSTRAFGGLVATPDGSRQGATSKTSGPLRQKYLDRHSGPLLR
jgi:hypothetical protein